MIQRKCKLSQINSFFLFGPRGVGKTTLLEDIFSEIDSLFIDLLDPEIFAELVLDSSRFTAMIDSPENRGKRVIIEGVQKIPSLLDIVHFSIQFLFSFIVSLVSFITNLSESTISFSSSVADSLISFNLRRF